MRSVAEVLEHVRTEPGPTTPGATTSAPVAPHRRRLDGRPAVLVVVLVAMGLALAARLVGIDHAHDVFIDEATYTEIAQTSSPATGPRLHGDPFVLHPPIGLLVMAGVHALDPTDDRTTALLALRPASALAGAAVVGVVVALLWRAGARRSAVAAGTLLALDPFTIRFDTLVMLEAFAQLAVVGTVACTARLLSRPSARWAVATALAAAVALGTKETFGLVALGTVALTAVLAGGRARRLLAAAGGGALAGYALVNAAMAAWAGPATWWQMRLDGLQRLLGLRQTTGFNAPGTDVTLWDRLLPNLVDVGATYALLALGGATVASLVVVRVRRRDLRRPVVTLLEAVRLVVPVWATTACAYLAYATLFGSLEEQMFHIAVTPCACVVALVVERRRVVAALVTGVVVAQAVTWAHVHTHRDDTHVRTYAWVGQNVPAGARVAVTDDVSQFLLTGLDLTTQGDPARLREEGVQYVLVSPRLATQGYGSADADLLPWLAQHGELLLDVRGRDSDLQVWDVRP